MFTARPHSCRRPLLPPLRWLAALLILLAAAPASWALTPAVLLDENLEQQPIFIQSLSDDVLTYFDAKRNMRNEKAGRFVRLLFPAAQADAQVRLDHDDDAPPAMPRSSAPPAAAPAAAAAGAPAQPPAAGQQIALPELLVADPQVGDPPAVGQPPAEAQPPADPQAAPQPAPAQPAPAPISAPQAAPATPPAPAAGRPAVLLLNDGQKLSGELLGGHNDHDVPAILFHFAGSAPGRLIVPLEHVSTLTFAGAPGAASGAANNVSGQDRLSLSNGDVLEGFLEKLGPDGWVIRPTAGGAPLTLPMARVNAVALANPAHAGDRDGYFAFLANGSRLLLGSAVLTERALTGNWRLPGASDQKLSLPLEQITRIDLPAAGRKVLDLPDLAWHVSSGGKSFGVDFPPRLRGSDLLLHSPVVAAFPLPPGASRFCVTARLAVPDSPRLWGWADLDLIIRCDGKELYRGHLDGEQRSVQINVPLRGVELSLEVLPGANGPLLDRLLLENALILVK